MQFVRAIWATLAFVIFNTPSAGAAQQFTAAMQEVLYFQVATMQIMAVRCRQADADLEGMRDAVRDAEGAHAAGLAAGKERVRMKLAASGKTLQEVLRPMVEASARLLAMPRDAIQRECASVVEAARSLAVTDSRVLLQRSFQEWLAKIETRQQMTCASLDERLQRLAPRFRASMERRASLAFDEVDLLLHMEIEKLEQAAQACQHAQSTAAAESISMPGSFPLLATTITAMADAANPLIRKPGRSATDRAEDGPRGMELLRSYLSRLGKE